MDKGTIYHQQPIHNEIREIVWKCPGEKYLQKSEQF